MKMFARSLMASVFVLISVNGYGALDGSGSVVDPYLINDVGDFMEFSAVSNAATYWTAGVYTKLMAGIDLDPALTNRQTYTSAVIAPDENNSSSGYQGTSYSGIFDGNDFVVVNVTIDTDDGGDDYLGLFGQVSGSTAVIKNLGVENCVITGGDGSYYLGGLCGYYSAGTISNCYATGSISGDGSNYLGGLCGYSKGTLSDCYALGSISGVDYLGGLCGYNYGALSDSYATGSVSGRNSLGGLCGYNNIKVIKNCYATGNVSGVDYLGGLCGQNVNGSLEGCYAMGDVSGDDLLGGLCGYILYSSVKRCYATGAVSGDDSIGGLCGGHSGSTSSAIEDCYATGSVSGGATADEVGGLCGYNVGYWVKNCYATGSVTGAPGSTLVGGLCGANGTRILGCFWDVDASGTSTSDGGKGLTTTQMKMSDFYSASGWDNGLWLLDVGNDTPHLLFESLPGVAIAAPSSSLPGSGTEIDPWLINTLADFLEICQGSFYWDKHYVLNTDIDLSGVQFCNAPLGYGVAFSGVFDGSGHVVTNLLIDTEGLGTDKLGLFGYVYGADASIINLGIENCVITGGADSDYIGGLVGDKADGAYYGRGGTISNCYATATLSGGDYIGGLCGLNYKGDIKDSYAIASVSGSGYLGGLCGWNYIYGLLSGCHAMGTVSGVSSVGGLCGYNESAYIDDCTATADVFGTTYYIGGLCGKNRGRWIKNSSASGSVTGGNGSRQVGGLCGQNYGAEIANCSASGNVIAGTSSYEIGGLCGENTGYDYAGTIDDCSASGSVTAGDNSYGLGGLCGALSARSGGWIKGCYATGHVTGGNNSYQLGGICGYSEATYTGGVIENCYATGNIMGGTSSYQLGGVCGYNGVDDYLGRRETIANCYSMGSVTGNTGSHSIGGVCGRNMGVILGSCWDAQLSGLTASDGGKGLTTAQMKQPDFYSANGWADTPWILDVGNDTPHLPIEGASGSPIAAHSTTLLGSGTMSDPFQINTTANFIEICQGSFYWDKCYILNADVDLNGVAFYNAPLGFDVAFTGVFDGNGHVVSNLLIDTEGLHTRRLGLFGTLQGEGSAVRNLGVVNCVITGGSLSDYVGGLCGHNDGVTIVNCYATGSILGDDYLGGLCGHNDAGAIEDCYATSSVTGGGVNADYLGGLCGLNDAGSIVYCYATGNISGVNYLGGLCGENSGTIPNCYATGNISGVNYLGGLCGKNSGITPNCYATGSVSGVNYLGGFCGDNSGTIPNCYSTGPVAGPSNFGGLCGRNADGTVSNCFWDTETSGLLISDGGTGQTTSNMQAEATFTDVGWDLQNVWSMASYPELKSFSAQQGLFSAWLAGQGVPTNIRGEEDCPMGDGIANLLKYACGLPAMQVRNASDYMGVLMDNGSATFTMEYYKSATATGVLLQPIWKTALDEAWDLDDITVGFVQNEGDRELWRASIPLSDESGFMSLQATAD
ncbi:GLUG motif-containing protein [Pontiella sulfatireligans]|uniref:GLUG domain-containing protein n=1 Tax=Pontiella sulfatireligans TaxID=2750658 RepID=A0A6C2UPN2_9BACT|nr:GLUG motif-containing protein [Pontiella sulfatireligans]VGO21274.1 hypothetical protein SCARR_03346 [Pontiella sulfatireligans]